MIKYVAQVFLLGEWRDIPSKLSKNTLDIFEVSGYQVRIIPEFKTSYYAK